MSKRIEDGDRWIAEHACPNRPAPGATRFRLADGRVIALTNGYSDDWHTTMSRPGDEKPLCDRQTRRIVCRDCGASWSYP